MKKIRSNTYSRTSDFKNELVTGLSELRNLKNYYKSVFIIRLFSYC